MSYFNSEHLTIFPTAHRQYQESGTTTVVNIESRLNTEYNITNLVNGLLDQNINNGNFVVDYSSNVLKFCMQGYYVELTNVGNYLSSNTADGLWVKLSKYNVGSNSTGYEHLIEIVPNGAQATGNLDDGQNFLGLDYVNSETSDYFQLLEKVSNGYDVPEKSRLRFSTSQIGYVANGVWHAISSEFSSNKVIANNLTLNFGNTGTSKALQIDTNGVVSLNDLSTSGETASGNYAVISKVSQNSIGKISVEQKDLPVSTNVVDGDDTQNINLITRHAVQVATQSLDSNKINKTDLTFSYNNGTLTITKNY